MMMMSAFTSAATELISSHAIPSRSTPSMGTPDVFRDSTSESSLPCAALDICVATSAAAMYPPSGKPKTGIWYAWTSVIAALNLFGKFDRVIKQTIGVLDEVDRDQNAANRYHEHGRCKLIANPEGQGPPGRVRCRPLAIGAAVVGSKGRSKGSWKGNPGGLPPLLRHCAAAFCTIGRRN